MPTQKTEVCEKTGAVENIFQCPNCGSQLKESETKKVHVGDGTNRFCPMCVSIFLGEKIGVMFPVMVPDEQSE